MFDFANCGQGCNSNKPSERVVKTLPNLESLQARVKGEVTQFGDPDYDDVRLLRPWSGSQCKMPAGQKCREFTPESHPTETWNFDAAGWPSAFCTVQDADDVAECVKYAEANNVPLCVAGGRHSHHCLKNNSLVIDMRRLRQCTLDQDKRILVCEGGALNGDAHAALAGSGLAMTLGHHPGTGLGGLVLQGGHGPLEKVFGLSVDVLCRIDAVISEGTKVTATKDLNPDLFWAFRGGCGNFGVVTAFHFNVLPMDEELASLQRVHLPLGLGPLKSRVELIKSFRDKCEKTDRRTSPLMILPLGGPVIEQFYYIGDKEEGALALQPYDNFGMPVHVEAKPRNYFHEICWDILGPSGEESLPGNYYPTSALLAELTDEACQVIADFMGPKRNGAYGGHVVINQLGGAAEDVPITDTAVGQRAAKYWIIVMSEWKAGMFSSLATNREMTVQWARGLRDALTPWMMGKYGQLNKEEWNDSTSSPDPLCAATWGANLKRLQEIKAKFDPKNTFCNTDNIRV